MKWQRAIIGKMTAATTAVSGDSNQNMRSKRTTYLYPRSNYIWLTFVQFYQWQMHSHSCSQSPIPYYKLIKLQKFHLHFKHNVVLRGAKLKEERRGRIFTILDNAIISFDKMFEFRTTISLLSLCYCLVNCWQCYQISSSSLY